MTEDDARAFERCVAGGGVAVFPADTVYGLATGPGSREGLDRIYALKGRPPERPSAVMFFSPERALAALPELGPRTRAALERLLPGGLTVLLENPQRRYPLACGPRPEVLGLRVPRLEGPLAPLALVGTPVVQTSANLHGRPDARRAADVDPAIRAGADLVLDAGELPGTPSTVVDLGGFEREGTFSVVREGAVPREALATALRAVG